MAWLRGSLTLTATAERPAAVAHGAVVTPGTATAERPAAVAHGAVVTPGAEPTTAARPKTPTADTNLNNILKLVPAEIVAPYVAGLDQVLAANARFGPQLWFALCLFGCMALRASATRPREPTGRPWYQEVSWAVTAVSGVAFFIWAHAVAGTPPLVPWLNQSIAGLAAVLFGVIAPQLVPAQAIQEPTQPRQE